MTLRVGERNLGEFARWQIETARRDPRLERGREAMVADFWIALEEAERARFVSILGLDELQHVLEREEARLGISRNDKDLAEDMVRTLQAAWERSELARIDIENGHPHLNAQALLSMNSALDALVEEFVPSMRDLLVHEVIDRALARAEEQEPAAAEQLTPELRARIREAAHTALAETMPKLEKLRDSGIERYERLLAQAGLAAPTDRPIPYDLDEALTELGALRDVLVHRGGRVDERALRQAPSLHYDDGELVRVSNGDYRKYSAAIRCYAQEVVFRSIRHWPEVSDERDGPNLAGWRGYCRIGA
ncbi:MAG TPA: hypothetical protein VF101_07540 [Gaiellaceae bacterium]